MHPPGRLDGFDLVVDPEFAVSLLALILDAPLAQVELLGDLAAG